MQYTRYAIYYMPPKGALADFAAAWLGWDSARGTPVCQPDVPGLSDITRTPRKYGFHATLKAPFQPAEGVTFDALRIVTEQMAQTCAPATSEGLDLTRMGRFLALTPRGDTAGIDRIAAHIVRHMDRYRAPLSEAEFARRRKAHLSARQDAQLVRWGYPYVMEDFRFHLTLTGRLPAGAIDDWTDFLRTRLPDLPAPFAMDCVSLMGERADGYFEMIDQHTLNG